MKILLVLAILFVAVGCTPEIGVKIPEKAFEDMFNAQFDARIASPDFNTTLDTKVDLRVDKKLLTNLKTDVGDQAAGGWGVFINTMNLDGGSVVLIVIAAVVGLLLYHLLISRNMLKAVVQGSEEAGVSDQTKKAIKEKARKLGIRGQLDSLVDRLTKK